MAGRSHGDYVAISHEAKMAGRFRRRHPFTSYHSPPIHYAAAPIHMPTLTLPLRWAGMLLLLLLLSVMAMPISSLAVPRKKLALITGKW